MAKVDIEKITLGVSPLTDKVFAGTVDKKGHVWLQKKDVTNSFLDCVIKRWEGSKEIIESEVGAWEVQVKKIK